MKNSRRHPGHPSRPVKGPSAGASRNSGRSTLPPRSQSAGASRGGDSESSRRLPSWDQIERSQKRIAVGVHAAREALVMHPQWVESIFLQKQTQYESSLADLWSPGTPLSSKIVWCSRQEMDSLTTHHQGLAVLLKQSPQLSWSNLAASESAQLVLLDGVEDPHNLGAVIRTSWLMGAKGLLIPADRAVGLTPTAHKVASGGVEHVPVEICTSFPTTLDRLREIGFWIIGLDSAGTTDLFRFRVPEKVVWCLGAEGSGLRKATARSCEELVSIPQTTDAASYNVSVAAAIALSTGLQQSQQREK